MATRRVREPRPEGTDRERGRPRMDQRASAPGIGALGLLGALTSPLAIAVAIGAPAGDLESMMTRGGEPRTLEAGWRTRVESWTGSNSMLLALPMVLRSALKLVSARLRTPYRCGAPMIRRR